MPMRLLPAFLLMSLLCACGQVGDLYLPAEKKEQTDSAPAPAPTPAAPAAQNPKTKKK